VKSKGPKVFNAEVLNLGVEGYGIDQMLLYLREEGVKYHPDIVILGFIYYDIYRDLLSFFAYAKPEFMLTPDRGLQLMNVPIANPNQILAREPYRMKMLDLLVILRERFLWMCGRNEAKAEALANALLREFCSTARSIDATPIIVYMPTFEDFEPNTKPSFSAIRALPVSERERFVSEACRDQEVTFFSLVPRFRQEGIKGADLWNFGHWSPRAHMVAAEEIAKHCDLLPHS
jgi:hypothetical protein